MMLYGCAMLKIVFTLDNIDIDIGQLVFSIAIMLYYVGYVVRLMYVSAKFKGEK